nr:hypothetical protein [Tanacetum cinerariifolium]
MEKIKTTQQKVFDSLKRSVKKLERRNRLRNHKLKRLYKVGLTTRVESSDEESLDADEDITLVNDQDDADMFDVNDLGDEEVKGVFIQEPSKSTTTIIPKQKSQVRSKGIMVEEHVKPKKKDQIRLDEEPAKSLQAEFDEEERLARERTQKEHEANIVLIET